MSPSGTGYKKVCYFSFRNINGILSYKITAVIFIQFIVLFSASYLRVLQWLPDMTKKRSFLCGKPTAKSKYMLFFQTPQSQLCFFLPLAVFA